MPKFETLSQSIFSERAKIAIDKTPVRKEISINLPDRSASVKRHKIFHDYRDELMELLRQHGKEVS